MFPNSRSIHLCSVSSPNVNKDKNTIRARYLLLSCNDFFFFKQIVTSDEKWIFYINVERKKSLSKRKVSSLNMLKSDLHLNNVMLYICSRIGIVESMNCFITLN